MGKQGKEAGGSERHAGKEQKGVTSRDGKQKGEKGRERRLKVRESRQGGVEKQER